MTVTASEGADDIISFLNTDTARTFSYLCDLNTAYAYLTIPSVESLALQHQLKEDLLSLLGTYNFMAAQHTSITTIKKDIANGSALIERLENSIRWEAYGYKSMAKKATKVAEKLGAACLLLRLEATVQQTAPEVKDLLIYSQEVIAPTVFSLKGQQFLDCAINNKTLRPVRRNSEKTVFPQKVVSKTYYSSHANQQFPSSNQRQEAGFVKPPFRNTTYRGGYTTSHRGGRGGYQSNHPGTSGYTRHGGQRSTSTKTTPKQITNSGQRTKTHPKPVSTNAPKQNQK